MSNRETLDHFLTPPSAFSKIDLLRYEKCGLNSSNPLKLIILVLAIGQFQNYQRSFKNFLKSEWSILIDELIDKMAKIHVIDFRNGVCATVGPRALIDKLDEFLPPLRH